MYDPTGQERLRVRAVVMRAAQASGARNDNHPDTEPCDWQPDAPHLMCKPCSRDVGTPVRALMSMDSTQRRWVLGAIRLVLAWRRVLAWLGLRSYPGLGR